MLPWIKLVLESRVMNPIIKETIDKIIRGTEVDREAIRDCFSHIMDGHCTEVDIASLLTALAVKGEATEEIVGAAIAMHERSTKITPNSTGLLDTCGTGGDNFHTFNISTATAFVIAAAGVKIAKHGNRSVSSSSGSADVLEALGVNIELTPEQVATCIDDVGIGFCYARLLHGAMKHAAPVRKQLGFRTIFNLLGPLTNPASAEYQIIGANNIASAEKLANASAQLNRKRCLVVCGNNELDEISLWGTTTVFVVEGNSVERVEWSAESFGLPECDAASLKVSTPQESAEVIKSIFANQTGPHKDMVVANAAGGFITAGKVDTPEAGARLAEKLLSDGTVMELLQRLIETTKKLSEVS